MQVVAFSVCLAVLLSACATHQPEPVHTGDAPARTEPSTTAANLPPAGTLSAGVVWWRLVSDEVAQDVGKDELSFQIASGSCVLSSVDRTEVHEYRHLNCHVGELEIETMAGCALGVTNPTSASITLDERIAISHEGNRALLNLKGPHGKVALFLECFTANPE